MWSRALAGIFAGFFLTAAIIGLVSWSLPGPWSSTLVGSALAFFPLWMGAASAAFLFRNGLRAWMWMGGLAVLGFAVLWGLRSAQWVA